MMLHSHKTSTVSDTPVPNQPDPIKPSRQGKAGSGVKGRGTGQKKKPKTVQFWELIQRSFRWDRVDQECRQLKIKYNRWPGTTEPKYCLHKSHARFMDTERYFPEKQAVPGDSVICPQQKYLANNWDKRRHYCSKHQEKLLVVDEVVMLHCKWSEEEGLPLIQKWEDTKKLLYTGVDPTAHKLSTYWTLLEEELKLRANRIISVIDLWTNSKQGKLGISEWITKVYNQVELCHYNAVSKERTIRDVLIVGCNSTQAKDKIIRKGKDSTLKDVLDILQTRSCD